MGMGGDKTGAAVRSEPELTLRGLILGAAITLVFTAANVYLGLRVGLTFATSIPAAVISMAALRAFKNAGVLENNIVQTVASAAGTLSSIIFVVPGLIMVGWWTGFPFWQVFGVCALGGALGVMFSIPLRRALVVNSDLPYPEGTAAAEVLKVGAAAGSGDAENRAGLRMIVFGALASAGYAVLTSMRLAVDEVGTFFRIGSGASGAATGFSMALFGIGHLVGISVGTAIIVGYGLAWWVATPILSALHPGTGTVEEIASFVWSKQVRFIGAGAIGVAALWSLGQLILPVWRGITSAMAASRARQGGGALALQERDLPIGIVGFVSVALLVPIAAFVAGFMSDTPLSGMIPALTVSGLIYIVVAGAIVSTVAGYMAGLIGASNSPVSGIGILSVLGFAFPLSLFVAPHLGEDARTPLVALSLFVTAFVFTIATIANDNLQDLKTGQLVGATPWRQQVALLVGVVAGAAVIPPVLDLLNAAYGFAGALQPSGGTPVSPLPAPQATLISALARGVLGGDLDWTMIGIGAIVGGALLVLDGLLKRFNLLRLPPLAVGLGIYLPAVATVPVTIGAWLGWWYERRMNKRANPESAKRKGVLMASGMIVGESLWGVVQAGLIVATGSGTPLAVVGEDFHGTAIVLGVLVFTGGIAWLYRASAKAA
jgi:putative OPT family oligopeptide transporter